jgi:hypothetical protein
VLDRWGIVKAAGPNNKLSETIDFFEELALEKIPLERLYKKLPPSFQTSAVTLHRILHYVRQGITRRSATALIITFEDNPREILIARDISTPRLEYGKPYGAFSIPMGFSKRKEARERSILRVLQQEVFTRQTIEGEFPAGIIPDNPKPFVYFDIADIRLFIYHLPLSKKLSSLENFDSYKLKDFQFANGEEIKANRENFRVGMTEVVSIYYKYLEVLNSLDAKAAFSVTSDLNRELASLFALYSSGNS